MRGPSIKPLSIKGSSRQGAKKRGEGARELLVRYMEHVFSEEGTYFLGRWRGSEADRKELEAAADEANRRAFGDS